MDLNSISFDVIKKNLQEEAALRKNYAESQKYSIIKSNLIVKIASFFVYFSLRFKIKPNQITFLYIFLVSLSFLFISFGSNLLIILGLFIYFFKNSLDLADGHLARITEKTSQFGHLLDTWAGFVSFILFQTSIYLYVYNQNKLSLFLFGAIIILLFYCIDFKKFYLASGNIQQNEKDKIDSKNELNTNSRKLIKFFSFLDYDGRSRYTDLVILIILVEVLLDQILLTQFFCLIWILTCVGKFSYKLYLTIQNFKIEKK